MERLTVRVKEGDRKDECFIRGNKNAIEKVEYIHEGGRWESEEYKGKAVDKLAEYEDLEEQGRLLRLPCAVGDTVYVLTECESIPEQLDGTLWDENGAHGTETGYYCPYENDCPFDDEDFEGCEKYKGKTAVFEDTVADITVGEDGAWIRTANCSVCSQNGLYIFLTRQEAGAKLAETEGKK